MHMRTSLTVTQCQEPRMKPNVEITLLNEEIYEVGLCQNPAEELSFSDSRAVPMMKTAILKTTSIGNVAAPRVEVTGVLYNLGRESTEVESHDEKPVSVYFTEPNMILDRLLKLRTYLDGANWKLGYHVVISKRNDKKSCINMVPEIHTLRTLETVTTSHYRNC
ncbi:hypothetical protein V1478_006045 [Vespula squamosa]|uniref:Uncharacterized protein n=1 Tax=Vespula squamosa TaxID=30214 RepID=A0ABD2B954_VESSQ